MATVQWEEYIHQNKGSHPLLPPWVSVPHQEAYSKSHYGECRGTGRQTDWLITRLSSRRFRHVLQRSRTSPQPSSHSSVYSELSSSGAAEQAPMGETANGLGRRGEGMAWLVQGAVSRLHVCTIFKGPTCSLLQLITEVQVKNSMSVNSISAEKKKTC